IGNGRSGGIWSRDVSKQPSSHQVRRQHRSKGPISQRAGVRPSSDIVLGGHPTFILGSIGGAALTKDPTDPCGVEALTAKHGEALRSSATKSWIPSLLWRPRPWGLSSRPLPEHFPWPGLHRPSAVSDRSRRGYRNHVGDVASWHL